MRRHSWIVIAVPLVLIFSASAPLLVSADEGVPSVSIHAHWMNSNQTGHDNAWVFTFESSPHQFLDLVTMSIVHESSGGTVLLDDSINASELDNLSGDNNSLIWRPSTDLSFGDQLTIKVYHDATLIANRQVGVTVWNQPIADHEVTISTEWEIDQEYDDEFGQQTYSLFFVGQGWQERVGNTLLAHELGNGTLQMSEASENGTLTLDLILSSIWRNETSFDGILERQEFEATGVGTMGLVSQEDDAITTINATVTDALFNRSYIGGSHSERIKLQALGDLSVSTESEDDNGTWIDGDLSLLMVETYDVDGVRILSLTHFEATAEMTMIDGDQRFDLEVDEIINSDRWVDGQRSEQRNKILAHGTFGFINEEENGSVAINGTVIDFHSESINGMTVQDNLHIDGTIEGEATGDFGIIRQIKESGTWHNINDTDFAVNVIHQESWFNITAVQGWSNGGNGVGTQHNETWMYDVPQIDWENRTIYQRWRSSGFGDNDEGEEYPEDSPIILNATAPVAEEGLGEANVSRETGLSPLALLPGDMMLLDGQDGMILKVTATATSTVDKDGHILPVTLWNGTYLGTDSGTANGAIVNSGILDGLIAEVVRNAELESPAGNPLMFNETQTLERVLSPSIVTAEENTEPTIVSAGLRTGLVVNEGGSTAHLEVEVSDNDWNIISVIADMQSLGNGDVDLNDVGHSGDAGVHDDVWTTSFVYAGILHGNVSINVTVTDAFGAFVTQSVVINIFNQAPRLTEFDFAPTQVIRGDSVIVNAGVFDGNGVASVAIDLRGDGGELNQLIFDSHSDKWSGMVPLPETMTPGDHNLQIRMMDDDGATITVTEKQSLNVHRSAGQEPNPDDVIPPITILNEGPIISAVTVDKHPLDRPNIGGEDVIITATISDPDGVSTVVINLADLSPPGMQGAWLLMNDAGQDGDVIADDGIWTYKFQTRSGMPLGTFAMTVRATDTYGAYNVDDSLAIQVVEDNVIAPGENPQSVFASTGVVLGLVGLLVIIMVGVFIAIVIRSKEEGGMKWEDSDAFGGD